MWLVAFIGAIVDKLKPLNINQRREYQMTKLVADTATGTIRLELPPRTDAPSFADPQPEVFEGELNKENFEEAILYFNDAMEKEVMDVDVSGTVIDDEDVSEVKD